MPLAALSLETVVPCFLAMALSVSPFLMEYAEADPLLPLLLDLLPEDVFFLAEDDEDLEEETFLTGEGFRLETDPPWDELHESLSAADALPSEAQAVT